MSKKSLFLSAALILSMLLIQCEKNNNDTDNSNNDNTPSITSTSPANGATGVSVTTTISVTFSMDMDHASVESVFSITPTVSGAFSWNGNTLTFTPSAALNPGILYTVTISSSASSSGGATLGSNYVFSFTTAAGGGRTRNFPDSAGNILILSDQLPDSMTDAQYNFAAQHYAGCMKMRLSMTRILRKYNPNFIMLHYRLAHGAGTQNIVIGDEWSSYWNDVNPHENWFIHITRGNSSSGRVRNGEWDWYYTDPSGNIEGAGSNGWKEYFVLATLNEMRAGECDGTFGDSCGLPFSLAEWPDWLSGTNPLSTWCTHVNTYIQYVTNSYAAQPERFYFIPNAGALVTSWDNVTDYSLADGVMVEGFSEWGDPPLNGELGDFQLQMNRILELERAGKIVIMQTYPTITDMRARMFAVGCYLLIKGHYSYINLVGDGDMAVFWFPEYDVDIGTFINEPPEDIESLRTSEGIYRRDYSNGLVLVNPTAGTVTVNLGGTYRQVTANGGGYVPDNGVPTGNLFYTDVTSLTLVPGEAAILLRY
jgi:hypothetical protein